MKLRTFHTLWSQFAPRSDRDDRLRFCSRTLGKAVDSTRQLSDEEFDVLISELRKQRHQGSGRVVSMRGQAVSATGASQEQVWKIHQLEAWLGWRAVPERLAGFLRDKFRADRTATLSPRDAWRAIEALFNLAAQSAGARGKTAKKDEVKRLKEVLRTWRPDASSAAS